VRIARSVPLTVTVLVVAAALAGPAHAAPATSSYLLDPAGPAADAIFPEGVATDTQHLYVGSTTDGTIYRGALGGTTATPFLVGGADGRTSAIGLKVSDGYLFVAGGATGRFFVYDVATGGLVGSYAVPATGAPTFLNDVAVAPDGSVYVTDSQRPVLYRVGPGDYATEGVETLPIVRDFTGTALQYVPDQFNVNGIVATPDGAYLVLAQSNTGQLYRVAVATGDVSRVDLGGATVSGDGLVLRGSTLYAVERQGEVGFVVTMRLSDDFSAGTVLARTTDPSFDDPTTAAIARGRLLVVNSQFGERAAGEAPDPFTVSSIPLP
jgi:sugar lactone lactonase YvrE